MTVLKICAVIMISFCAVITAKQANSPIQSFIPIAAFAVVILAVIPFFTKELNELLLKYDTYDFSKYLLILFKALGISFICSVTSEICSSCGENLLSEITILAGKIEILILCMPLIVSLLNISGEII